jgi:hypothetical protein
MEGKGWAEIGESRYLGYEKIAGGVFPVHWLDLPSYIPAYLAT